MPAWLEYLSVLLGASVALGLIIRFCFGGESATQSPTVSALPSLMAENPTLEFPPPAAPAPTPQPIVAGDDDVPSIEEVQEHLRRDGREPIAPTPPPPPPVPVAAPLPVAVPAADEVLRVNGAQEQTPTITPANSQSDFGRVRVFYATDRKATGSLLPRNFYSSDRADEQGVPVPPLAFGFCDVSIPNTHEPGELESPYIVLGVRLAENPAKHVVLLSVTPQSGDQFAAALKTHVAASARRDAFVFIHGYNVSFEDSVRRTAQIAWDLRFTGAPITYSWPSEANLIRYNTDEANVEWTTRHLAWFLQMLKRETGADTIHLIAHSMGSRALIRALELLSFTGGQTKFEQLVLAAPDFDASVFRQVAQSIQPVTRRTTLYASSADKAMLASKRAHGYPRAGEAGDALVVLPQLDTIDASRVETDFLSHGYMASNKSILSDVFYVLRGAAPEDRAHLRARQHTAGRYWEFPTGV
jgi:esterase/lipase superfamily enzyme